MFQKDEDTKEHFEALIAPPSSRAQLLIIDWDGNDPLEDRQVMQWWMWHKYPKEEPVA